MLQKKKIKVLLADDHDAMRGALRQVIETQEDITIVGEASNGKKAVELAIKVSPNIIIMDVNMPLLNGIAATNKILSVSQDVRIIGLSLHNSKEVVRNMLNAGASAYLSKSEAYDSLIATIRSVASDSPGFSEANNPNASAE